MHPISELCLCRMASKTRAPDFGTRHDTFHPPRSLRTRQLGTGPFTPNPPVSRSRLVCLFKPHPLQRPLQRHKVLVASSTTGLTTTTSTQHKRFDLPSHVPKCSRRNRDCRICPCHPAEKEPGPKQPSYPSDRPILHPHETARSLGLRPSFT